MDWQPQIIKYNQSDPESSRPSNILIDGVTFQNFKRSGPSLLKRGEAGPTLAALVLPEAR